MGRSEDVVVDVVSVSVAVGGLMGASVLVVLVASAVVVGEWVGGGVGGRVALALFMAAAMPALIA